ncbi:MAG: M28 family peptidase [Clostridia bacterium]|nr:M28 family peptidase [Clostridia bacterium]
MTILEQLNEKFPIRRTKEQKAAFREWVKVNIEKRGYSVKIEKNDKDKHYNIVVGNPDKAEITFTAHYDTPGCIGIPNLLIPRNWGVYFLYQALVVGGMLAIALGVGLVLGAVTQSQQVMLLGYFGVYLALLMSMLYGPANKHNVNDNTSGVAALLELMSRIPAQQRGKVAFILFDNEEKGCRGSKAYAKDHLEMQHTGFVVNLDCVGVGEHIILSVPALAKNMDQYEVLSRTLTGNDAYQVHQFSSLTTRGNSDFRSFKCGIGVSAHKWVKGVGYMTTRIHTGRDTQADQANIDFLAERLSACVEGLFGQA